MNQVLQKFHYILSMVIIIFTTRDHPLGHFTDLQKLIYIASAKFYISVVFLFLGNKKELTQNTYALLDIKNILQYSYLCKLQKKN